MLLLLMSVISGLIGELVGALVGAISGVVISSRFSRKQHGTDRIAAMMSRPQSKVE